MDKIKQDNSKPCPFCGGIVKLWVTEFGVANVIECESCQTRFMFPWNKEGFELRDFWNERADG